MKNLTYTIIIIISLIVTSCFTDKSNYEYTDKEIIAVEGIESVYSAISQMESVVIEPKVTSNRDSDFEYYWGIYELNVQGAVPKMDTISKTKDLNYFVDKPARSWMLVFNAKNIKTGISKIVTTQLDVETEFTRGWYVAKHENGFTDLDLFLTPNTIEPEKSQSNLFSLVNGYKLSGKPLSLTFYNDYKSIQGSRFLNTRALFILSEEDASVVNISTLGEIRGFENLFFSAPSTKRPQFVCDGMFSLFFVNDGLLRSLYNMSSNTGQFGVTQMINSSNDLYRLSKYFFTSSYNDPVFFDEISSSFVSATGTGLLLSPIRDAATTQMSSNSNNKRLIYMGHKTSNTSYALFEDKSDPSLKILSHISPSIYSFKIINDTLSPISKIYNSNMHTLLIGDENLIYFAHGNEIWSRNLTNKYEQLQFSIPSDENISFIRHRKYSREAQYSYNYVMVGSKKDDSYIIRMFKKTSGNLESTPDFVLSGKGEARDVIYISPMVTSTTYPNTY